MAAPTNPLNPIPHFVRPDINQSSLLDMADAAAQLRPAQANLPLQLITWQGLVFKHVCGWEYEYVYDAPNVPYLQRRALWDYEEHDVEFSEKFAECKGSVTESERAILIAELERYNGKFSQLKIDLHDAVQSLSDLSFEMMDPTASKEECLRFSSQIDQDLISIQKELLEELEHFQNCHLKFLTYQRFKGPSNRAQNFFKGGDFLIQNQADQVSVDSLYRIYEEMLNLHGLYLARFLGAVIATRDFLSFARRWNQP